MRKSQASGFRPPRVVTQPEAKQEALVTQKKSKIENSLAKEITTTKKTNAFSSKTTQKQSPLSQSKTKNLTNNRNPTQLPSVSTQIPREGELVVWKVYQTKRTTKKHKNFEDGFLAIRDLSLVLKDEEGTELCRTLTTQAKIDQFSPGSSFAFSSREVEFVEQIATEEYTQGKLFLNWKKEDAVPSAASRTLKAAPTFKPFKMHGESAPKRTARPLWSPAAPGAVILYSPTDSQDEKGRPLVHVVIDPLLSHCLRPHQKEGVKFMFDCVMGFRPFEGFGCILADEMGLGKTLQTITLIWTLLKQGIYGKPTVSHVKSEKILVVTPTSLVANWKKEIVRWLGSTRLPCLTIGEASKGESTKIAEKFRDSATAVFPLLIISYEQVRVHANILSGLNYALIACDEGHRIKNSNIQTSKILSSMNCSRRIILSGTPIQNDLEEFYAMCNFVNPGILGSQKEFKAEFEKAIVSSLEKGASREQKDEGEERSKSLSNITSQFILRRTQSLLDQYLPPKNQLIVCCAPSPRQIKMYKKFLEANSAQLWGGQSDPLTAITTLKKLCNHPDLLNETKSEQVTANDCGKLDVVMKLLSEIKANSDDKVVFVSHSTKLLDLFETICHQQQYSFVRMDGSTETSKRQKIVDQFNQPTDTTFLFLLSTKAGGVGFNLIGANRLIMFSSDWNPAIDNQAMARIWRDGQKKNVWIYRLFTTGTIEEKIYQRQLAKDHLSETVFQTKARKGSAGFKKEDLMDIFSFADTTPSDTHDLLNCPKCQTDSSKKSSKNSKLLNKNQLLTWDHSVDTFPDPFLQQALAEKAPITFVFSKTEENIAKSSVQSEENEEE